jgi:hypothetical protein
MIDRWLGRRAVLFDESALIWSGVSANSELGLLPPAFCGGVG